MLGIFLVNKPQGITSHDVVHRIRRILHTKRVGHAGTLDPLATGLLVVAVGPATRFLQYLPLEPKEYTGTIRFGAETNTQDADGEITRHGTLPDNLRVEAASHLPSLRGLIQQIPPMFSAIKKGGQPLYALARQGKEVEREARTVHIHTFDLETQIEPGLFTFKVVCSGGTYVRTLAHDLGQKIGCGAHLASLVRTRVGKFNLEDSCEIDAVGEDNLVPLSEAIQPMPQLILNDVQNAHIRQGRAIEWDNPPQAKVVGLVDLAGDVFGVARVMESILQPEVVIPIEAAYGST